MAEPPKQLTLPARLSRWYEPPKLSRARIVFAFAVAVGTDTAQILTGPLGWVFLDELLDVIAMGLTMAALGFHLLLLPTFLIEMFPVADMLPTWTGCTAAVVMLRTAEKRRTQNAGMQPPINVEARTAQNGAEKT